MVKRALRNSSQRGDMVLDPFGGSGTTLIAAETTGRRAALLELDPKYVDVDDRSFTQVTTERFGKTANTPRIPA